MKSFIFSILFVLSFSTTSTAQFSIPAKDIVEKAPDWAQLMYSDNPNAFEVARAYKAYYKDRFFVKNMHNRNYKFWKRSIKYRMNADGSVIKKSNKKYKERLASYKNHNNKHSLAGNWSLVGPIQSVAQDGRLSESQACVFSIDQSLSNSNILFCGTEPGEVYKSIDGGDNWTNVSLDVVLPFDQSAVTSVAIHPTNPNEVYFISQGLLFKSTNGGTTWNLFHTIFHINGDDILAEKIFIHPTQPNIIMVASNAGLTRTTDSGVSWTSVYVDPTYDLEMNTASDNIIYALRKNETSNVPEFFTSTNFGASFTQQTNGWYNSTHPDRESEGGKIAVTDADPNRVYAVLFGQSKPGDYGHIGVYRSDNGGSSWTLPNGPAGGPYTVSHPNLASQDGGAFHADNITADATFCALTVSPSDPDKLLIGGLNLWKSDDGGLTFEALGGYINGPLNNGTNTNSFHVDQQEYKVFGNTTWLTTDGGIYKSNDFFSSPVFEKKNSGIHSTDFWGFGSGWNKDVLIGGVFHNGVLVHNETYGSGVYLDLGGGEPSSGYVNPGENNLVYSMDVGGVIIPDVLGPVTEFSEQFESNEVSNALEEGYSDYVFHPQCYSIAYTGKSNELWRTTDKGLTFEKFKTFGNTVEDFITFIHISRADPNIMYLCQRLEASDQAKLWKSLDAGITWTETPLPAGVFRFTMLQVDPYDPAKMWIASSTFDDPSVIFKSVDSGANWTNITSPTIGEEYISTLDYIPGTNGGIYIGTNLGIYYKNDSMTNWMDFSNGLPAVSTTRKSRPFYRDNKLRISSTKGMWESELMERPDQPFAQIMANEVDTCMQLGNSYRFVDYSMLKHQGATWEWTFEGGTPATGSTWFQDVTFDTPGAHQVILKITDDRGLSDSDTLNINVISTGLTLDLVYDNFSEETSWDIKDSNGNIVSASGIPDDALIGATQNISCIGSGCFTFTMYDSAGDGMCCSSGNGSFTLTDASGLVLASGGSFGTEITSNFCICKESEFITGATPTSTTDVSNLIESDGQINNPEMVVFNAGFEIDLQPQFEVQLGAMFLAQIQTCVNTSSLMGDDEEQALQGENERDQFELKFHDTNPTFAMFELYIGIEKPVNFEVWDAAETVKIISKTYEFSKAGTQHLKFDHSNLPQGDYQIKVFTDSHEKIIKYTKE